MTFILIPELYRFGFSDVTWYASSSYNDNKQSQDAEDENGESIN